jgi:predicted RNA-binding Zn ribbon-like protein
MTLALANARKPRRPPGARVAQAEDPLEDTVSAAGFLRTWGFAWEGELKLSGLRRLQEVVEALMESMVGGGRPADAALESINDAAAGCGWVKRLTATLKLAEEPRWRDPVAGLAARCLVEIAACDSRRIKRCARPECGLFFYDTTRNANARWHQEAPCGWRARAQRRRKQ